MADAAERSRWNHTSNVIAAMFNSNPFRDGPPITASQVHPYIRVDDEDEGPEISAVDLALMVCGPEAVRVFAEADKRQQA